MPDTRATVHIVDDDGSVRDALAVLFLSADVQARTYDSPAAFLAEAPYAPGDCFITDLQMPQMDGLELVRRLRVLQPDARVLMITARADSDTLKRAQGLGVRLIEKPFDGERILAAALTAMDG